MTQHKKAISRKNESLSLSDTALQDVLAVLIFLTALLGEGLADRQLAAFKADPDNRKARRRDDQGREHLYPGV